MLDIEELERQWKQYNRKRKRPLYITIILFLLIILAFVVAKFNIGLNLSEFIPKVNILQPSKVNDNKDSSVVLSYMDKAEKYLLNDSLVDLFLSKNKNKVQGTYSDNNTHINTPLDENEVYIDKDISKPSLGKKQLSIIKVANTNAYRDVERRFRRTHNINDAIFLANMYYNKRNYKKAIYWSMQTNKLDKNIEESWLIFAKSKIKIGKKNEAIRVLRAYIKRSNSYEAKKLLKKIINR